jgi:hypothetical protein
MYLNPSKISQTWRFTFKYFWGPDLFNRLGGLLSPKLKKLKEDNYRRK